MKRLPRKLIVLVFSWVIAFSLHAELFVSGFNDNKVYRYNETNGAFINIFVPNTNNALSLPHGLAFGPDGNLYVASAGNDCVIRYNGASGAFMGVFATNNVSATNGTGVLDYPVALIFRGPHLYVSSQLNDRVLRYNATNGAFVDLFVTNNAALSGPSDMVFGLDGNLYVVGRFNSKVVKYNGTNGALMGVFVTNNLQQPFGLRFGADTNLYVVSSDQNCVNRFSGTNGAFLNTFVTINSGGISAPIGIDIGPDGNFYIASYNNNKVSRFSSTNGSYLGDFVTVSSGGLSGPNFMLFHPTFVPSLSITLSNAQVLLRWATNAPGFQLQGVTGDLSNTNWTVVSNSLSVANGSNVVAVTVEEGGRFFRLRK